MTPREEVRRAVVQELLDNPPLVQYQWTRTQREQYTQVQRKRPHYTLERYAECIVDRFFHAAGPAMLVALTTVPVDRIARGLVHYLHRRGTFPVVDEHLRLQLMEAAESCWRVANTAVFEVLLMPAEDVHFVGVKFKP